MKKIHMLISCLDCDESHANPNPNWESNVDRQKGVCINGVKIIRECDGRVS